MFRLVRFRLPLFLLPLLALAAPVLAQDCPGDHPLQNDNGAVLGVCPCFIVGEEAGVVLTAPAEHYPIEILSISITWSSQFGGAPQTLEQALHLYAGGLPDPGSPIFTLLGPQMTDGFINQFNIEPIPGDKTIASGPFTVTLEFANQNSGNIFAASVVYDTDGCQPGKNVIKAIPGGWSDACSEGVSGDWVMSVVYRCSTPTDAGESAEHTLTSGTGLLGATPNPFVSSSRIAFALRNPQHASLRVYDVRGRVVATLTDRLYGAGQHFVTWQGQGDAGDRVAPGAYFLRLEAGDRSFTQKIVVRK